MVSIGVVTAALVVVLSVFNGFEDLVKQMYGDFYADIQLSPASGKRIDLSEIDLENLKAIRGIKYAEPVMQERAILLDLEDKSIVWLKGVTDKYNEVSGLPDHMLRGEFLVGDSLQPCLVLGVGVEQSLQIVAGQSPTPVTVYLPNPEAGPSADPTTAMVSSNAFVTGSFAVQQEFDEQYAFTNLSFLQYLLGIPANQVSFVEVYLQGGYDSERIKAELEEKYAGKVLVKTRFEQNQALFSAMKIEKLIIFAIAFLILVIAGFNIVSSLTMTAIEKQKDIAVLKALGASDAMVSNLFKYLGLLLSGFGAVGGMLVGLIICFGQQTFHWVKLGGQSFIIDYYPVAVRAFDLLMLTAIILGIALLAAWLPSRRAIMSNYSLR
jgi:lipoprotein-releasing system permease protein